MEDLTQLHKDFMEYIETHNLSAKYLAELLGTSAAAAGRLKKSSVVTPHMAGKISKMMLDNPNPVDPYSEVYGEGYTSYTQAEALMRARISKFLKISMEIESLVRAPL